jgi:hypothetical protein
MSKEQQELQIFSGGVTRFLQGAQPAIPDDIASVFEDDNDMEGVVPRLPQISIAHQAQLWIFPDESKTAAFDAIIIGHNRANGWWKDMYAVSGGKERPDCSSTDGITPTVTSMDKQHSSCLLCPKNQFGSDGGRGKACKNMKRIHILLEGSVLPHRITLPPTSLQAFDRYVTDQIAGRGLKLALVMTRFSLIKVPNADGIEYSEISLSVVNDIDGKPMILAKTKEDAESIKSIKSQWSSIVRGQEILSDEMTQNTIETPTHSGPPIDIEPVYTGQPIDSEEPL